MSPIAIAPVAFLSGIYSGIEINPQHCKVVLSWKCSARWVLQMSQVSPFTESFLLECSERSRTRRIPGTTSKVAQEIEIFSMVQLLCLLYFAIPIFQICLFKPCKASTNQWYPAPKMQNPNATSNHSVCPFPGHFNIDPILCSSSILERPKRYRPRERHALRPFLSLHLLHTNGRAFPPPRTKSRPNHP